MEARGTVVGISMIEPSFRSGMNSRPNFVDATHPNPIYCFRLGEAYEMDGKYPDAIAALTKAELYGQASMKQIADNEIAEVKKKEAAGGK